MIELNSLYENIDLAEYGVEYAQKMGANHSELFLSAERSQRAQIEKGKITVIQNVSDSGAFLRIITGGQLGSVVFTDLTKNGVTNAVSKAMRLAKVKSKSSMSFPELKGSQGIHFNFDKKVAELDSEDMLEAAKGMVRSVRAVDKGIKATDGLLSSSIVSTTIANSNGVSVTDVESNMIASMRTKIKKVNTGNGYDYCISRDTDGLDFEGTARKSAEQSITSLKKKRIKPGKYTVLFEPHAFADIVKALVIPAVCGVNVQHKASFLDGKMSTRIARDNFTLVDDGTWVKGVNRCHVDHEGTPAQKTALIDRGNLVGLLYDHSSARREEKASTGNGIRFLSPSFDRVYRYTPAVEGTNTIVAGGITSKKDLIEGVNDGILVSFLIGSWSFNFSNGTFSADARNSYRIEKGRITYAIDEATVSGNVTDLIMDIQIGNDTAQSRGCIPLTPAVVATPSVVSNNVIVGA